MSPASLVLDLETVPDAELYTPPDPLPEGERTFPPLFACQPIVIGYVWVDETLVCRGMGIMGEGKDEAGMLGELGAFMAEHRPNVITWNGRGFDLPVLTLRALRHGVAMPWYYEDPAIRDRRAEIGHIDVGDFLANYGAARMTSLDGAARLIGLPGKDGMDGSQVEELYRAGELETVRRYCLADVVQTAFVYLRTLLLRGQLDRAAYTAAAANLFAAAQADGRLARLVAGTDRRRLLLEG
jgi:3'-5' exonuclease